MKTGIDCMVCGNTLDATLHSCPFCGARSEIAGPLPRESRHRIVNLERGLPIVAQALQRFQLELETARRHGYQVLTLIHGYGSSGKGGAIREEVRSQLSFLHDQGTINDFLRGEDFTSRTGRGRQLLRRFPLLSEHRDLNRANPGITLVVL